MAIAIKMCTGQPGATFTSADSGSVPNYVADSLGCIVVTNPKDILAFVQAGFNFAGNLGSVLEAQFVTKSSGNGTLAAGDMEGSGYCILASSGATAFTTRTATQLVAGIPNAMLGGTYILRVFNTNGGTLTLTGGSGVTITGVATIATTVTRDYIVTITNLATPAVTMQSIGSGSTA
jgi:hypothetical protein